MGLGGGGPGVGRLAMGVGDLAMELLAVKLELKRSLAAKNGHFGLGLVEMELMGDVVGSGDAVLKVDLDADRELAPPLARETERRLGYVDDVVGGVRGVEEEAHLLDERAQVRLLLGSPQVHHPLVRRGVSWRPKVLGEVLAGVANEQALLEHRPGSPRQRPGAGARQHLRGVERAPFGLLLGGLGV